MNNPQMVELIEMHGHVQLAGKIVGRTRTAPITYDVMLDCGQIVRGIPANYIKPDINESLKQVLVGGTYGTIDQSSDLSNNQSGNEADDARPRSRQLRIHQM